MDDKTYMHMHWIENELKRKGFKLQVIRKAADDEYIVTCIPLEEKQFRVHCGNEITFEEIK